MNTRQIWTSTPRTSYRRWLQIAVYLLLMSPSSSHSQTMCATPNRCASGEAINAAAEVLCRRARVAELRLTDKALPDLAACQTQRDEQAGQTRILQRQLSLAMDKPTPYRRSPWVLRWGLDIAIGATSTTTGLLLGAGAPVEWAVGFGVAAVAVLVGRLILEALD